MTDDNAIHVILLAWILYSVSTEAWIRGMALFAAVFTNVAVIVKFFI